MKNITINNLIIRYWKKTTLTWILVILEGFLIVGIPIFIGWAIDDLKSNSYLGLFKLGVLCYTLLAVGALRRSYDTRIYSRIFKEISYELVESETLKNSSISKLTARVGLFDEFISFLENSIPGILNQFISLIGTLGIIFFINKKVFLACLVTIFFTMLIYKMSENKIYNLNSSTNDEFEKQVDLFTYKSKKEIKVHFTTLAKLQVALSDLDTKNFSLIWFVLSAVLIYAIYEINSSGTATFGQIVSAVMYVFNLVESLIAFPMYYMEMIRLKEITQRLE